MNKTVLTSIFLIFFSTIALGQSAPSNLSLLTLQCKSGESICHNQEIVRYDFAKGEYISKETVLSLPTDKGRFDLGYTFYEQRYLVSDSGTIFDIRNRKILGNNRGWVKDIIEDNVIIEDDTNDSEGFLTLNLKTNRYKKLKSPNIYELEGRISPDRKKIVTWSMDGLTKTKFEFYEILPNLRYKKFKTVKSSFSAYCSIRCSSHMSVPFVWLDNDKIITQRENGRIISIDSKGHIEDIVNLNIKETPDSLPSIEKDEYGNVDYYCNGEQYAIFIKNKTFEKNKTELGNDFYMIKNDDPIWKSYFYKNKSIGKFRASGGVTSKGFIAIYHLEKHKHSGYYDGTQYWNKGGINIWNDIIKDWIKIEVDWGVQIIGWLEDK